MSCCVLLPEYVPLAVNVTVDPVATVVAEAVRLMDTRLPGVTVIVLVAVNAPDVAVTVVVQELETLAAVTTPVLLTVAHEVSEEVQLTDPVRFLVLPSL